MRTMVAAMVVAALLAGVSAQAPAPAPKQVSLISRGGPARAALEALCAGLKAELRVDGFWDAETDLDFPVWIKLTDSDPARAVRLLSLASGLPLQHDAARKRLHVHAPEESRRRGGVIRGYDVSIAAGRYVQHVDAWGAPRPAQAPGTEPLPEMTAAEYVASTIEFVLHNESGLEIDFAVAGDRLVLRGEDWEHAHVTECLELLSNDSGGISAGARRETELRARLAKAEPPLAFEEIPLASALAQICEAAGTDFFIRAESVEDFASMHVNRTFPREATASDALDDLFPPGPLGWWVVDGAVSVGQEFRVPEGYRVFEIGGLLKKLDAALQRQRTAQGRLGGFTGDLRERRGAAVVEDGLAKLMDIDERVAIESLGSRLIVRGSEADLKLAEQALVEMGWETPRPE